VPIGLIHSSWGGTYIESWTSPRALAATPASATQAADVVADTATWRSRFHQDAGAMLDDWFASHDAGSIGDAAADPRLDDSGWAGPAAPASAWAGGSGTRQPAIAWFRRVVDLPAAWTGKDLTLALGPTDTEDVTWFNGERVGSALVPWDGRAYDVPGRLVGAGRNVIAVRIVCHSDTCGLRGAPTLRVAPDGESIALADGWRVRQVPPAGREPYRIAADPWVPSSLYNAKIAPLLPFAIRGVIWYQGEQNTSAPGRYAALLTSLIGDWRRRFATDLPFGIVQLANFGDRHAGPVDSNWAALRDAQRRVARDVAGTGLVVTTDIGDAHDIHPKNKQDVGGRLAGWALATTYGQGGEWSGPLPRSVAVEGGAVRVTFDHADGLAPAAVPLPGFEVAGADGRFVAAEARVDGASVLVSAPAVLAPVTVRYAWDDDPEGSLVNAAGLPASPFEVSARPAPRRARTPSAP
jgi:sialate O-acetylesterase